MQPTLFKTAMNFKLDIIDLRVIAKISNETRFKIL